MPIGRKLRVLEIEFGIGKRFRSAVSGHRPCQDLTFAVAVLEVGESSVRRPRRGISGPLPVRTVSGVPLPSAAIDRICVRPGAARTQKPFPIRRPKRPGIGAFRGQARRVSREQIEHPNVGKAASFPVLKDGKPAAVRRNPRSSRTHAFGTFSSVSLPFRSTRSNVLDAEADEFRPSHRSGFRTRKPRTGPCPVSRQRWARLRLA